ncbi:DUF637 domain-containing protein [Pseudoalteromonas ardens]|uniref:DUF637 domain-containing protein n=1 Tax=Pseudoalteromonas rubra TaxID=43658 RepID=A0A0L0EP53_9GAMM|nr:DUF637 domain-containing protein [Pseudoalteromonas sp. R96]KNC65683.1 hypothetical protein AC626_21595 [Pseudoalteromonas rubra]MDK1310437.1 DUF637 domain-containing protein [Pseudoalteromonas sp. R96]
MKNNNFNPEKPISLWQKCVGYLNIALLVGQLGLPTLAQAFTLFDAQQATAELNADPAFTKVSSSDSQFVKSDYVVESSQARSAQTIETFHAKLVEHNKSGLNPPKYIPIANKSITIIFPHYELAKRVGDRFVQSRMVRTQIYNQLNRTLINGSYTNETQQINDLYNNAFEFAGSTATKFGDKVTESNLKSFNKNFIWPELQTINGEQVLVPVVHLTQSTVDSQRVDGHVTEFGGSRAEFRSITINSGTLKTQRDTFVKTAKDLTVMPRAEIRADGDLNLFVGGTLQNLSGRLSATQSVNIVAGQYVQKTVLHRYSTAYGQGTRLGEIASVDGQDIRIHSYGDLVVQGGEITGNTIGLRADGNIRLISQQTSYSSSKEFKGFSEHQSEVEHLTTKLSAKDSIYLMASGAIELKAAELHADQGVIDILALQGVYILNEFNQSQSSKSGKWGKTTEEEQSLQTMAIRSALEAGKGVRIASEFGDVTLQATKISSGTGTRIDARNGKVNLLLAKEQKQYFYNKIKKSTWKIKTETKQDDVDTAVYNEIIGGVQVNATHGITLELGQYEGEDVSTVISSFAGSSTLGWMNQLYNSNDANVSNNLSIVTTELQKLHIDKKTSSLSPAAMAIIAIAVSVAMGPAGAQWIGTEGAIAAAFESAAMGSAMSAAAVTLATQAATSLAAGNSIGDTLETMTSGDSVRNLVVAMATAGMLSHFSDLQFFGEVNPDAALFSADTLIEVGNQATQAVVNSTISAGISTAINGGDFSDFSDSFTNSLKSAGIAAVGEYMSSSIGAAYKDGDISNVVRYLAHAGAGCLLGAATSEAGQSSGGGSESCLTGAGGAVVGELVADAYKAKKLDEFYQKEAKRAKALSDEGYSDAQIAAYYKSEEAQSYFNKEVAKLTAAGVDLAKLGGATAAMIANSDVNLAAMTAENAAQHNALFLIPLGLMVLKGIDIALTANELYDIYDTMGKNPAEGQKMLEEWLIDQAAGGLIGKAIPGFKTFEEMLDWLKRNNVMSSKMLEDIEDNIGSGKQGKPSGDINVVNAVDKRLDLGNLGGEYEFLAKVNGSHIAKRNDGFYGEQIAKQIFDDSTGLEFVDLVKNKSNHGADLLGVDDANKTIWLIEVKSSVRENFPKDPSKLNLLKRGKDWINNVASGKLNGQEVTSEAQKYAKKLQSLQAQGYKIKPILAKVKVPKPGTTGTASVSMIPAG